MARVNPFVCDCGKPYTPKKGQDPRIKCAACVKKTTSREIKAKAVAYLGGKCVDCQYEGHPVAFDFDHKDPKQKEFKISGHYKFRWKELKRELDKCALRCSNCHRVRHYIEEFGI
jgi:hypothetical protein